MAGSKETTGTDAVRHLLGRGWLDRPSGLSMVSSRLVLDLSWVAQHAHTHYPLITVLLTIIASRVHEHDTVKVLERAVDEYPLVPVSSA